MSTYTGTTDIHHHQAAFAAEATRGWWINRGGGFSCRGCPGKNIHQPGLFASPGWPWKQGPLGGGGNIAVPEACSSFTGTGNAFDKRFKPQRSSVPHAGQESFPTAVEFHRGGQGPAMGQNMDVKVRCANLSRNGYEWYRQTYKDSPTSTILS